MYRKEKSFKLINEQTGKSANIVELKSKLINEHVCLLDTWEYLYHDLDDFHSAFDFVTEFAHYV